MALLTKKERQTLDRAERRELRTVRRAERARQRGDGALINVGALRDLAVVMLLDRIDEDIPGPDRMDEVLDDLVELADLFLIWTWAGPVGPMFEAADGFVLQTIVRLLIRPHVQRLFDDLRAAGEI